MKDYRRKQRSRRGQQLVEYLLLFTIVIGILLIFVSPSGPLRKTVNRALEKTTNQLDREAAKIPGFETFNSVNGLNGINGTNGVNGT
jgi:hypothetical protein